LTAETHENNAIFSKSEKLQNDIDKLDTENKALRNDAMELRQRNRDLVADLHVMQNNVTTVIEFTVDVLNQSHSMLEDDVRLHVLTELAKNDEEHSKERKHKQRLMNVARAHSFSLLQMTHVFTREQDPHGVLQMMDTALDQLETEENTSIANLTASFDRDFKALMSTRAELLEHQEELNSTKDKDTVLKAKLKTANKHLETTHKK